MKVIDFEQLRDMIGLSRSTVWRLERAGKFPQRIRLSANSVGWPENEVLDWLASRPRGMTGAMLDRR